MDVNQIGSIHILVDDDEEPIREHPQNGYDTLKDVEFEQPVAQIVRQHHEMMNVPRYPQSIAAVTILLSQGFDSCRYRGGYLITPYLPANPRREKNTGGNHAEKRNPK